MEERKVSIYNVCQYDEDIFILLVTIKSQEYLAISCFYCEKIRLYNMMTGEIATAFQAPNYRPGHIYHGDTAQIYVIHEIKNNPLQQLDCSHPQFRLIQTLQSGMAKYYAIQSILIHKLIALSLNKDPKMI